MYHQYRTSLAFFSFLEAIAWCAVVIGVLSIFGGFIAASQVREAFTGETAGFRAGMFGTIPGFVITFLSLLCVVLVQIGRAAVDTAAMTDQILLVSREQLQIAKDGYAANRSFAKEPMFQPGAASHISATTTPSTDTQAAPEQPPTGYAAVANGAVPPPPEAVALPQTKSTEPDTTTTAFLAQRTPDDSIFDPAVKAMAARVFNKVRDFDPSAFMDRHMPKSHAVIDTPMASSPKAASKSYAAPNTERTDPPLATNSQEITSIDIDAELDALMNEAANERHAASSPAGPVGTSAVRNGSLKRG